MVLLFRKGIRSLWKGLWVYFIGEHDAWHRTDVESMNLRRDTPHRSTRQVTHQMSRTTGEMWKIEICAEQRRWHHDSHHWVTMTETWCQQRREGDSSRSIDRVAWRFRCIWGKGNPSPRDRHGRVSLGRRNVWRREDVLSLESWLGSQRRGCGGPKVFWGIQPIELIIQIICYCPIPMVA